MNQVVAVWSSIVIANVWLASGSTIGFWAWTVVALLNLAVIAALDMREKE